MFLSPKISESKEPLPKPGELTQLNNNSISPSSSIISHSTIQALTPLNRYGKPAARSLRKMLKVKVLVHICCPNSSLY